MAQNNEDFTAKEYRVVMKYCFLKWNLTKENDDDVLLILGDKLPSYSTVKNWVARFGTGHLSTEDKEHSGRPPNDNSRKCGCHSFHDPGLRKISAKDLAETLSISRRRVGYIIQEILVMRKLSAK
jgi:hypothetical protein